MNNEQSRYFYGVMATQQRQELGPIGIGGRGDMVYTLPYKDIAAIISPSPITKYEVSRENTITHAKVLDKAAEESTVLPVKFCTIAESENAIIEKVLKSRYQEFIDLIKEMSDKIELGVRVLWKDMDAIYAELVDENSDMKALKTALLKEKDEQKRYAGRVKIGEMVQKALEARKTREGEELMEVLKPLSVRWKENPLYGDKNLLNAVFLAIREKEKYFDEKISYLEEMYGAKQQLKYTRSLVPYNFVEVVIRW